MKKSEQIQQKLTEAFAPTHLEIRNDSERHAGHAGYGADGESHFHVTIRAAEFGPMSRIARHRAIHSALGADLVAQIHALSLDIDA